jgi:hypothetical protein
MGQVLINNRFLLVRLQLQHVLANQDNVAWALKSLPTSVEEAYRDIMNRIEEGKKKTIALKILSWVLLSRRLLKMRELREALSVNDGEKELTPYLMDPLKVVECCESLITYDDGTQTVRLTHYTLDSFLRKENSSVLLDSYDLAKTCLTYLGFDEFERPCRNQELLKERIEKYTFSAYAVEFWGLHTRGEGEKRPDIQQAIFRTFRSESRSTSFLEIKKSPSYHRYSWSKDITETSSPETGFQ